MNIINPPNVNLSQVVVDSGLDLSGGDYDIGIKAGRTVDGVDISNAIAHANIVNRTREIFIPANAGYSAGTYSAYLYYASLELLDAADVVLYITKKMPVGLVALTDISFVISAPDAVGTDIVLNVYLRAGSDNEPSSTINSSELNAIFTLKEGTKIDIQSIKGSMDLSGIDANDVVGLAMSRGGSHASDDYQGTAHLIGIILEYTADM